MMLVPQMFTYQLIELGSRYDASGLNMDEKYRFWKYSAREGFDDMERRFRRYCGVKIRAQLRDKNGLEKLLDEGVPLRVLSEAVSEHLGGAPTCSVHVRVSSDSDADSLYEY